jgi:hypothetical protein
MDVTVFTASESVFSVELNTSVARTNFSWFDSRVSARPALVLVKVLTSWAGVFVLVVLVLVVFARVVFARDDAVAFVAVAFVPRAVLFNGVSISPVLRKSV